MSFNLDIILRVITAPNSAFAEIRDNEDKYFVPSVGLFLFTSALGALVLLPFVMIPFDDAYFEGVDNVDLPTGDADRPQPGAKLRMFVPALPLHQGERLRFVRNPAALHEPAPRNRAHSKSRF